MTILCIHVESYDYNKVPKVPIFTNILAFTCPVYSAEEKKGKPITTQASQATPSPTPQAPSPKPQAHVSRLLTGQHSLQLGEIGTDGIPACSGSDSGIVVLHLLLLLLHEIRVP